LIERVADMRSRRCQTGRRPNASSNVRRRLASEKAVDDRFTVCEGGTLRIAVTFISDDSGDLEHRKLRTRIAIVGTANPYRSVVPWTRSNTAPM